MSAASEQQFVVNWLEANEECAVSLVGKWLLGHPQRAKTLLDRARPQTATTTGANDTSGYVGAAGDVMASLSVDEEAEKLMKHFGTVPNQQHRAKAGDLRSLDKHSLFMELLRDVISPNFDVNSLSHKILVNVMLLVNADRSSLFLADENGQVLVSRLFDVMENSTVEDAIHAESEAIKIPFGVGIAGNVAATGQAINLENAYNVRYFYEVPATVIWEYVAVYAQALWILWHAPNEYCQY